MSVRDPYVLLVEHAEYGDHLVRSSILLDLDLQLQWKFLHHEYLTGDAFSQDDRKV